MSIKSGDLSNSDDTIAYLDEDDDAGIFSISNDYTARMRTPSLKYMMTS